MSELLFHYRKVDPTTWAYLSSLLMLGLYFKFSRFWSVRNVDLVLLVLLSPGLLLTHYGSESKAWDQPGLRHRRRRPPNPAARFPSQIEPVWGST